MALVAALAAILDAAFLRPLPYADIERLVGIEVHTPGRQGPLRITPSLDDIQRLAKTGTIEDVTAWSDVPFGCIAYLESAATPDRVEARQILSSHLRVYGRSPLLGRDFAPTDEEAATPLVALISHQYWQARLGGMGDVIGRSIHCNQQIATVVGILPPGFHPEISIWLPLRLSGPDRQARGGNLTAHGRLVHGVDRMEAEQRVLGILAADTETDRQATLRLTSVLEEVVAPYRSIARALTVGVALLFLVCCVNVVGISLTRSTKRSHEMAVRVAIGATRSRVLRQLFLESVLLWGLGGMLGLAAAWVMLPLLVPILPVAMPPSAQIVMSPKVVAGVLALTIVLGLFIGAASSLRVSMKSVGRDLSTSTVALGPRVSRRRAQWLIAAQVALALALSVTAVALVKNYARLLAVDLGFDVSELVAFRAEVVSTDVTAKRRFYETLVERIAALPGIDSVGAVDHFPLADSAITVSAASGDRSVGVRFNQIVPGYFRALRVRPVMGTLPDRIGAPVDGNAVVVNESAARRLFSGPVLGAPIAVGKRQLTVVGMVPDFRSGGPLSGPGPEMFLAYDPADSRSRFTQGLIVVARTRVRDPKLGSTLEGLARAIGPPVLVSGVRPGRAWLADRLEEPRERTLLFSLLGIVAGAIMLVGVFGATAYTVAQRTSEIGLRIALGATSRQVVAGTLWSIAMPILLGLMVGVGLSLSATNVVGSFVLETSKTDVGTIAIAVVAVGLSALAAAWVPARRAAAVDPLKTLRAI